MRGLVFEFKSLATSYSATPYIGYVAMGTQYNSLDPEFVDKKTLENSEYSNSCKSDQTMMHPVECAKNQLVLSELYVRDSLVVPSSADKRMYDMGEFTIATGGQATDGIIGELWATYEVEFYQAKGNHTQGTLSKIDHFYSDNTCTLGYPLGTAELTKGVRSNLGGDADYTTSTYSFPENVSSGFYLVEASYSGVGAVISFVSPVFTNCVNSTTNFYNNQQRQAPENGVTATDFIMRWMVKVQSTSATIAFSIATVLPTASYLDLTITQIPPNVGNISKQQPHKPIIEKEEECADCDDDEKNDEIIATFAKKFGVSEKQYLQKLITFNYNYATTNDYFK